MKKILFVLESLLPVLLISEIHKDKIVWVNYKNGLDFYQTASYRGMSIRVKYVPKEELFPVFGWAGSNEVCVRKDLPPRVMRFVLAHEIYHCADTAKWGGMIGLELRANLIPGLRDPIGLLLTIKASCNRERIKYYWRKYILKKPHPKCGFFNFLM